MQKVLELDLFKDVAEHFEQFYRLPPLTARIYALLIFNNCAEGLTFEDLLDTFCASKSSISHSISLLTDMGFIEQYKKENERKRYFRVNKNLFLLRLREVQKMLTREAEINKRLREYRKSQTNVIFKQDAFDAYIGHLKLTTDSLENTILKLKNSL